jgi:hypothetical protein
MLLKLVGDSVRIVGANLGWKLEWELVGLMTLGYVGEGVGFYVGGWE